ncbi:MAG: hypothetical protein HYR84_06365 [Planctomycetes bacterium]|nr:hypothetical protein [Planctomycetota bacterium]
MNDTVLAQLTALVESAVAPVLASRSRKEKMREELLAHVTAVFEQEFAQLGDEQAALARTSERFGKPADLTQQLQDSITWLGYVAWFFDEAWLLRGAQAIINHDRMYTGLLAVLCLYAAGGLALLGWLLGIPPESRPDMQWPDWSLPFLAAVNAFFLGTMSITLIVRLSWPEAGRHVTKVMNVLFLLGPPLGTALGIYGLWKVDRELDVEVAS